MVFVNAGQEDLELAQKVSQKLAAKGYFCLLPLTPTDKTKASDVRKDLEQNLLDCDISLLLYAKSSPVQVRNLLKYAWKMNSRRKSPLRTAICVSDHEGKSALNVNIPLMRTLNCKPPISQDCIDHFVEEMVEQ